MNYNTLKHIVDDKTKFYIVIIRWIKNNCYFHVIIQLNINSLPETVLFSVHKCLVAFACVPACVFMLL